MTNQKPSFRSACLEFATMLSILAVSAFVAGYVVGRLGGSGDAALAGGAGAVITLLWSRKR